VPFKGYRLQVGATRCKFNNLNANLKMKLAAIYNCWNDWDWLEISVKNIEKLVDGIIIIASEKSNWGEISPIPAEWIDKVIIREPFFNHPLNCETDKRNFGLSMAKKLQFTHFIQMDCDELYEREPFLKAKDRFLNEPELQGLVCRTQVYFKSPKLTLGLDHTLVPFIHKLTPFIKNEFNKGYPYAWERGNIHIDPSRSFNINSGVKMDPIIMHHYSWVRSDYEKKIRNSTARFNILKDKNLLTDLRQCKEGDYIEFYRARLARATVDFGIPEFYAASIQGL
jgi:hypothetical protein